MTITPNKDFKFSRQRVKRWDPRNTSSPPQLVRKRVLLNSTLVPTSNMQTGPLPSPEQNERIQIVNEDKEFTKELNQQITRWGLGDAGFGYNLVSVFGSQSTGKSTLLNRVFGTTFDVMNETQRRQTTKGIWMCRGQNMNVMVMDVEGTDGRERGEDQDFERKSALFSLASSEVLIVNLWEHQVGLYQGANMGLLKTVFEVNLSLFGKSGSSQKTMLLFVIRDHIGATPLANLSATLQADMQKIWDALAKACLGNALLTDYFDLTFTTLPHKLLQPDKFEEDVVKLRTRFTDRTKEDFVFKPAYHKRIPADGVAHYMEGIWEQVQTNKDLDLPTQQELLAQFRCDEIAAVAIGEFDTESKSTRRPIESGKVVEGLGKMMGSWKGNALARFDRDASRYHAGVYQRKRADLLIQLDTKLGPLFLGQVKNLHRTSLSLFKKEVLDGVKVEGYSFAEVVGGAREKWEGRFREGAAEALLPETDWSYDEELASLQQEFGTVADQLRADETKKMINSIERSVKRNIAEPVALHLNKPRMDMWDKLLKEFKEMLDKAEKTYIVKAKSFNTTDEENETALAALRKRTWLAFRAKVDEQTADNVLMGILRTHFEEKFRYDAAGVPRVWRPDDDIDGAFRMARDDTLKYIPVYAKIQPQNSELEFSLPSDTDSDTLTTDQEFDFAASLVVLPATKQAEFNARFRRDADAYYVEAKRSTVSSIAQIPVWMYGVLVILGWNEAMFILFNPLYFALLVMALASAWIVFQLNMAGPLLAVLRTVSGEVQRQATDRLREHFREPVAVQNGKPHMSRQSTAVRTGSYNSTRTQSYNGTPTTEKAEFTELQEM
ncbi:GTP-binding protein [Rhizoctonia solani]|uniref:GTP-binding protein n=2 Tax=Rhizoctonia solani TaxID=456999 RepID=A0A8H8P3H6_9AGAM|nr:GTP-binding protein [Rhizoctonia solani]QRW23775.1 GTP-binding protein [Rhizoctonia solani]